SFRDCPPVFEWAKEFFAEHIDGWGYQESREEYVAVLRDADVVVSTADHEFFGLAVAEAVAAGCYPLVPNRLAYPELLNADDPANLTDFFYEGGAGGLAARLADLGDRVGRDSLWHSQPGRGVDTLEYCDWQQRASDLDGAIEAVRAN
ncbi:MAG: glycosyltransferase, partial [Phycisphaerae bacterium]